MMMVTRTYAPHVVLDCGAHHREGNKRFRVSIMKNGSRYTVNRHVFFPQNGEMEVEYSGSLMDCIDHVNQKYGHEYEFNRKLGGERT
jgi:hypothetical protein